MPARDRDTELGGPARAFPPTRHSALVELASAEPALRRAAEETLVRAYWKPAYAYARIAWHASNEDAKELVQGFFAAALEKRLFDGFDPARGRFRSFLRSCLDHHVQHVREAARREKRGGGARPVALDPDLHDPPDSAPTPDEELDARFRREWARHLFELGIQGLEKRSDELGKQVAFGVFTRYDLHDSDRGPRPTYAEIATELAIPETQVTNHLHWARQELRKLLYAELRAVTASEAELADEARWILGADEG